VFESQHVDNQGVGALLRSYSTAKHRNEACQHFEPNPYGKGFCASYSALSLSYLEQANYHLECLDWKAQKHCHRQNRL